MADLPLTRACLVPQPFDVWHSYDRALLGALVASALVVTLSGWAFRGRQSSGASRPATCIRWASIVAGGSVLFAGFALNVDLSMPHGEGNATHLVLAGLYALGAVLTVAASVSLMQRTDRRLTRLPE